MKNSSFFPFQTRDSMSLAAVLAIGAVFLILRWGEFPIGAGMDDAYYIELARSLAEGRGPVISLNDIQPGFRPGVFPIGFPLLLAPAAWLAPASLQIFKLVPTAALSGLVLVCLLLGRPLPGRGRLALCALFCLNPWTVTYAVRVFSDLPFAMISLAAVLLFFRLADAPRTGRAPFLALVLITGAAIMIRSIGLALLVAMTAYWLWHRRWRRALLVTGGVTAVLLPQAIASGEPGGGLITRGYLQQVFTGNGAAGSRIALMCENLFGYVKELAVVMVPVFGSPLENLAGRAGLKAVYGPVQLAVGILLAAGICRGLMVMGRTDRVRSRFIAIYLAVYGGVLLNFSGYPSGVQSRLLLPVLPLLFLVLLAGLDLAGAARRNRILEPVVWLLLALSLFHNGYRAARPMNAFPDAAGNIIADPGLGADWIRDNTDSGNLVMVRRPLRQHIHLMRSVVGFGTVGRHELDRRVETFGVDYIFLGPGATDVTTSDLAAILESDPGRFRPVHRVDEQGIRIFRVAKIP